MVMQLCNFSIYFYLLNFQIFDLIEGLPFANVKTVEGNISTQIFILNFNLLYLLFGSFDLPFHLLPCSVFQIFTANLQLLELG
jgi:hypothetical protein